MNEFNTENSSDNELWYRKSSKHYQKNIMLKSLCNLLDNEVLHYTMYCDDIRQSDLQKE